MSTSKPTNNYFTFSKIGNYCKNLGKYSPNSNYNQMANGCKNYAVPLSKINRGQNTSTNTTAISNAMRYSQIVNIHGSMKSSTSYAKKTCSLGGPTFSY